jgi:hypothetical protein
MSGSLVPSEIIQQLLLPNGGGTGMRKAKRKTGFASGLSLNQD